MVTDVRSRLGISDEELAAFCRKWKIARLELFGSVLRDDFDPDRSDIDFLVTFEDDAPWTAFDHIHIQDDLASLLGRSVDLISREAIEEGDNWMRRKRILESARDVYPV
jgi:predicted nucleotidyltransferase